ncbi:MAG: hypothetical protein JNM98_06170 [Rhodocyclaceae bacterium]|nr:hypothetical protein [Rhodocyclaceae bacterium]
MRLFAAAAFALAAFLYYQAWHADSGVDLDRVPAVQALSKDAGVAVDKLPGVPDRVYNLQRGARRAELWMGGHVAWLTGVLLAIGAGIGRRIDAASLAAEPVPELLERPRSRAA